VYGLMEDREIGADFLGEGFFLDNCHFSQESEGYFGQVDTHPGRVIPHCDRRHIAPIFGGGILEEF
jgi:hypothetical protein